MKYEQLSDEAKRFLKGIIEGSKDYHKEQLDEPIEDQLSVQSVVWSILEDRREYDPSELDVGGIEFMEYFEDVVTDDGLDQIIKDLI